MVSKEQITRPSKGYVDNHDTPKEEQTFADIDEAIGNAVRVMPEYQDKSASKVTVTPPTKSESLMYALTKLSKATSLLAEVAKTLSESK